MYKLKCCLAGSPNDGCWELAFRSMENAKREAEKWDAARELDPGEGMFDWELSPFGYYWSFGRYREYIYYIEPIVFEEDDCV